MAKFIPFTEARAALSELLDEIGRLHEHIVITRNGRPAAVLLAPDDWEAIEETLEILGDAETLDALRRSDEDVAAGRVYPWDEVKRDLGLA